MVSHASVENIVKMDFMNQYSDNDDNDYILDPDLMWDRLPQPYRMINKLLKIILDDVWYIIQHIEATRMNNERNQIPIIFNDNETHKVCFFTLFIYIPLVYRQ